MNLGNWHRVLGCCASATARRSFIGFIVAIAIVSACSDGNGEGRSVGIPDIDAVIDAVESHDPAELRELVQFQTLGCTHDLGAGGPPKCADGEPEGAEIRVFEFHSCAVDWRRESASDFNTGVDAALADTAALEPLVYAAFRPSADYVLSGEYSIIFTGANPLPGGEYGRGVSVAVEDGLITAILWACDAGDGLYLIVPADQTDFLLEPPE